MKKVLFTIAMLLLSAGAMAQTEGDGRPFAGYLYNKEYNVYMRINFYDEDIVISWQEIFGPIPGFIAKKDNNVCWMVTSAQVDGQKSVMEMTNDYGSEDLVATLTQQNDSVFILRQQSGSTIKLPEKDKWQKLPSTLTFIKRK